MQDKETHSEGRAAEEIVELAEELGAGLIVMGSEGVRKAKEGFVGQCHRCGGLARSLSGHDRSGGRLDAVGTAMRLWAPLGCLG